MFLDLLEFMVFYIFILLLFTCVAGLLFGKETTHFHLGFTSNLFSYYQTSLGSWNLNYYDAYDIYGKSIDNLSLGGKCWNFIFLLGNNVLLLNYVIAVLSSTFAKYETK
jgi:hypothetical protein